MAEKILLDTDIGSDIDDAVCLAYLLMQPEAELLGVTTVTGEGRLRAQMVSAICRAAGREVIIVPGAEQPLLVEQRQPVAQQAVRLDRWPHATEFPAISAVEFMAEQIMAHPGEVTLLAIGPLTNVALLFAVYPQAALALKALVLMCGVFTEIPGNPWKTEWNAMLDPHATEMVYRAQVGVHRSVGLDVTRQVTLPAEVVRERFTHSVLAPVLDFSEVWFAEQEALYFHDPLAAVTIFTPEVCEFSRGMVTVNSDSAAGLPGSTTFNPQVRDQWHEVALDVHPERFFDDFFGVFSG